VPEAHEEADADPIEDLELDNAEEAAAGDVAGGRVSSPPAGPVPIPYPNVNP
jgi:hypothetical protein